MPKTATLKMLRVAVLGLNVFVLFLRSRHSLYRLLKRNLAALWFQNKIVVRKVSHICYRKRVLMRSGSNVGLLWESVKFLDVSVKGFFRVSDVFKTLRNDPE